MKEGTKVRPTKKAIKWYQKHNFEGNQVRGKISQDVETLSSMLMWAYAHEDRPVGRVIYGTPSEPETTVKVSLSNSYGSYEHYFEKKWLKRCK